MGKKIGGEAVRFGIGIEAFLTGEPATEGSCRAVTESKLSCGLGVCELWNTKVLGAGEDSGHGWW